MAVNYWYVTGGETFAGIAQANGLTVAQLRAANPSVTDINRISVGQVLTIPGTSGGAVAPAGGNYPAVVNTVNGYTYTHIGNGRYTRPGTSYVYSHQQVQDIAAGAQRNQNVPAQSGGNPNLGPYTGGSPSGDALKRVEFVAWIPASVGLTALKTWATAQTEFGAKLRAINYDATVTYETRVGLSGLYTLVVSGKTPQGVITKGAILYDLAQMAEASGFTLDRADISIKVGDEIGAGDRPKGNWEQYIPYIILGVFGLIALNKLTD